MASQPFYHVMDVLFTATADVSAAANTPEFREALGWFLRKRLGNVVVLSSVEFDAPVNAEPGDPGDL